MPARQDCSLYNGQQDKIALSTMAQCQQDKIALSTTASKTRLLSLQ
jgi:hypothetical protein